MRTLRSGGPIPAWLAPVALFALALVVRWVASGFIHSAPTEGSAYYVAVARNLVEGRGLVSDAIWSFATPPLVTPKPAFELWLPMASFVSALPMALLGATLAAAQLGIAVLGALVAPLAWLVARDAAAANRLDARRAAGVAIGAGLLAAVTAPFVLAVAGPDSTTPFLVFGTLAALLMPRALEAGGTPGEDAPPDGGHGSSARRGAWRTALPGLGLGVALGLAYLSRQEAIWLGVAFLVLLVRQDRAGRPRFRRAGTGRRLLPVIVGGLVVVTPWLVRDALAFGTPFPGQALENAFLRHNEDIFAWLDRPTFAGFLAQGPATIIGHVLDALRHDVVEVLVLPAFPVGVVGLLALVALRRTHAVRGATALAVSLLGGTLTLLTTDLAFPVATQWGTFQHASGPLLVALIVCAALGGDALLARISVVRGWERPNVILAPIALLAIALPLAALQIAMLVRQADGQEARMRAVAADLERLGIAASAGVLISDHPMWLSDALASPVVALPDEPPAAVAQLAAAFGAEWLVVFDERGRYPGALLATPRDACLAADPEPIGPGADPAWLFRIDPACVPS